MQCDEYTHIYIYSEQALLSSTTAENDYTVLAPIRKYVSHELCQEAGDGQIFSLKGAQIDLLTSLWRSITAVVCLHL